MTARGPTASQTVGPFFHDCLLRADARRDALASPQTEGVPIRVHGHVYDGDGVGVADAMLELWQADHRGRYPHPAGDGQVPRDPAFVGFGRVATDAEGRFSFTTVKPGAVPFDDRRWQAPHICVAVFARGLLNHLFTRLYFHDEAANADDPVLLHVPAERRSTLVARAGGTSTDGSGPTVYRFDIVLQGSDAASETVFFNLIETFFRRHLGRVGA